MTFLRSSCYWQSLNLSPGLQILIWPWSFYTYYITFLSWSPWFFRKFIYIIWTWQRNKAFIKLNICNVFSLKSPFLYFIIIKVQAYLILLPCAFLCFTDTCVCMCVSQIEGLWPPCIDLGAIFPMVFTHFKALCHILAIFTIFQAFCYCYICDGDLWSVILYYCEKIDLLKAQMMDFFSNTVFLNLYLN